MSKFIPIDMTQKINTIEDLLLLLIKSNIPKYNKVVFLIDVKQISNRIIKYLEKWGDLADEDYKDMILMYNKDNYQSFIYTHPYSDAYVTSFYINTDCQCDICFENDLKFIKCSTCAVQICHACFYKIEKTGVCCLCKTPHNIVIKKLPQDIV